MLEALLPPTAIVVSTATDREESLFQEEEQVIADSVEKRRREFVTGRACAHEALERLGVAPTPVLPGRKGEPRWPAGVVGSITHCEGYRACALARVEDLASLGIDAEPDGPLPAGLLSDIALPSERRWIGATAGLRPECNWDRLLFCVKESIYKAWFPLTEAWLGFEDAVVTIDPRRGTFFARLLVPTPSTAGRDLTRLTGRWSARDGLLFAAVAVPAAATGDLGRSGLPE
jgi:4'-phosphopantetheinyl transferase EntD